MTKRLLVSSDCSSHSFARDSNISYQADFDENVSSSSEDEVFHGFDINEASNEASGGVVSDVSNEHSNVNKSTMVSISTQRQSNIILVSKTKSVMIAII